MAEKKRARAILTRWHRVFSSSGLRGPPWPRDRPACAQSRLESRRNLRRPRRRRASPLMASPRSSSIASGPSADPAGALAGTTHRLGAPPRPTLWAIRCSGPPWRGDRRARAAASPAGSAISRRPASTATARRLGRRDEPLSPAQRRSSRGWPPSGRAEGSRPAAVRSSASPASTVRGATRSTARAGRRSASTSRARSSAASMSRTSRRPCRPRWRARPAPPTTSPTTPAPPRM